jgi:hypothetical protein
MSSIEGNAICNVTGQLRAGCPEQDYSKDLSALNLSHQTDNSRWKNERYRCRATRRSSVETLSPRSQQFPVPPIVIHDRGMLH